jgi:hypothetical protein
MMSGSPACCGGLPRRDSGSFTTGAYRQVTGNYQRDQLFFVREMLCSLGMRGQWNYAMGLGPMLDGTVPPEFEPIVQNGALEITPASWADVATYGAAVFRVVME